jgi:hypothetical protein
MADTPSETRQEDLSVYTPAQLLLAAERAETLARQADGEAGVFAYTRDGAGARMCRDRAESLRLHARVWREAAGQSTPTDGRD